MRDKTHDDNDYEVDEDDLDELGIMSLYRKNDVSLCFKANSKHIWY